MNIRILWLIFTKILKEYNPSKESKILTVFDMIADMLSNKKLNPIVTELFVRGRQLNVSLTFYTVLFCCAKIC